MTAPTGTVVLKPSSDAPLVAALFVEVLEEAGARPGKWYGKYQGIVRPFLEWQTEFLGES